MCGTPIAFDIHTCRIAINSALPTCGAPRAPREEGFIIIPGSRHLDLGVESLFPYQESLGGPIGQRSHIQTARPIKDDQAITCVIRLSPSPTASVINAIGVPRHNAY